MASNKGKAPTPPDPQETANAQTQSNRDTAITQAGLNMIDQSGPWGSLTYTQNGTWEDGTPRYSASIGLSPEMQAIFNNNMGSMGNLSGLANSLSGQLGDTLGQPLQTPDLNTTGGQAGPIQNTIADAGNIQTSLGTDDWSADRQRVEDALMGRLNPQLDRDRAALENQLRQQGITVGSAAYANAMDNFNRGSNDARTSAILGAGQEQSRLQQMALNAGNFANSAQGQQFAQNLASGQFGNAAQAQQFDQSISNAAFGNSALQQGFQNDQTVRNQAINELMSLMSGSQVQQPQFANTPQTGVAGTDVAGIIGQDYSNRLGAWQQQQNGFNSMLGGLFSAGAGLLGAPAGSIFGTMLSDERAKENIEKVAETSDGTSVYRYNYIGDPEPRLGLIAQDVLKTKPEAVVKMGSLLAVNYDKALEDAA